MKYEKSDNQNRDGNAEKAQNHVFHVIFAKYLIYSDLRCQVGRYMSRSSSRIVYLSDEGPNPETSTSPGLRNILSTSPACCSSA